MSGCFSRHARSTPQRADILAVALVYVTALALTSACARVFGSAAGCCAGSASTRAEAGRVKADVEYLASDRLEGRGTGTAGNDSASAYIARRFAALGLIPLGSDYRQAFVAHPLTVAHSGQRISLPTQNVAALLPGRDPSLRGQYVVIGAHFDHLGRSSEGALDPENKNAIRNGADDNASGTAALLELARLLSATPPRRSIVFAAFSGEEMGLLGSQYFVEHSPIALDSVAAMINFDMVGRLRDDKLIVYGIATASELPALLDSANSAATAPRGAWRTGLRITALGDGFGPSDHSSFYARNIPVLHFFTDLHEDYHRASDDAGKINATGEAHVIDVAERVTRQIADRPARLTFLRSATPSPVASGSRQGSDVYLGSIPDMSDTGGDGLRLTGVRAGSPAEEAGLTAGDVIVEFGGRAINDLQQFSEALYSHKPGDTVSVVILRNGSRRQFQVRLGRRG